MKRICPGWACPAKVPTVLILTRRVGEIVMIGDDITVAVLGVKGNEVRGEDRNLSSRIIVRSNGAVPR
jgi:hypothetical protein